TTSTLAVGVNLPAHLVIIKGTSQYINGQMSEYSELDLMQMMGRAGRPQFDDSGVVVIITSSQNVRKYERLGTVGEIVESCLHESLIEHLNAEIVLGSVTNMNIAISWLKSTFLYVRIKKNPSRYNLKITPYSTIEKTLDEIFVKDLNMLLSNGLAKVDNGNNTAMERIKPTEYGDIMAKSYLRFRTTVNFMKLKRNANVEEALMCLCTAQEFSEIRFHGDKTALATLSKSPLIRFPLKLKGNKSLTSVSEKINILLQCELSSIPFIDEKSKVQFERDLILIHSNANRLLRGMRDVCLANGDGMALRSALQLTSAITAKSWGDSIYLLKQVDGIGPTSSVALANAGVKSFNDLKNADERKLEYALKRNPPFGNKIKTSASTIPALKLTVTSKLLQTGKFASNAVKQKGGVELAVKVMAALVNPDIVRCSDKSYSLSAYFLAFWDDGRLENYQRFFISKLKFGESFQFIALLTNPNSKLNCHLMNENYVGLDSMQIIPLNANPIWFSNVKPNSNLSSKIAKSSSTSDYQRLQLDSVGNTKNGDLSPDFGWDGIDDEDILKIVDGDQATVNPILTRDGEKKNSPRSPKRVQKAKIDENIRIPCSHACKHKESCLHECCKNGVLLKTLPRKRKAEYIQSQNTVNASNLFDDVIDLPDEFFEMDLEVEETKSPGPAKKKTAIKFEVTVLPSDPCEDEENDSDIFEDFFKQTATESSRESTKKKNERNNEENLIIDPNPTFSEDDRVPGTETDSSKNTSSPKYSKKQRSKFLDDEAVDIDGPALFPEDDEEQEEELTPGFIVGDDEEIEYYDHADHSENFADLQGFSSDLFPDIDVDLETSNNLHGQSNFNKKVVIDSDCDVLNSDTSFHDNEYLADFISDPYQNIRKPLQNIRNLITELIQSADMEVVEGKKQEAGQRASSSDLNWTLPPRFTEEELEALGDTPNPFYLL
ncbi:Sec63, partial [Nowakowskiella sp. JEL0407]